MFGIKFKKQKDKKKEKINLKYKNKSKAIKKAKNNLPILKSLQKTKQTQNKPQRYRDKEFVKYRTKTLSKAIKDTANTNSIAVFKEQIYNINYLSLEDSDYALQNNLATLDDIIDFVENTDYLLDPKYTEDIWHIKAELYHLKSMVSHQDIYNSTEIRQEIDEIIAYTSEHL